MSRVIDLLPEGRLTLSVEDEVFPHVESWIPLGAPLTRENTAAHSSDITVRAARAEVGRVHDRSEAPALLRLGSARAIRQTDGSIALFGESATHALVELDAQRAIVEVVREGDGRQSRAGGDVYSMLTIAAALVLASKEMALVHAGGVVDRSGGAWLVIGDSHSGKTSTCTALVDAGWSFLADDQIVLSREPDALRVWGWPRKAHLDDGWARGDVTGERGVVSLVERWPARVLAWAPLAGVLLPSVMAAHTTEARAVHPAEMLTALIRQSPWLISDALIASRVLPLMQFASMTRAYELVLGRDSYARGDVLEACLASARVRG
jgi:hypothetical protein